MKPAQKLLLSCRQTGEAATRLGDWLDLNPSLLGNGHGAVREDLEGLAARILPLARAADSVPGIGLVATDASAKCDVLFSLIAPRGPVSVGELGPRPIEPQTLRSLMPVDGAAGGCAILRLSTGDMPPAPRGYPIRIVLLSLIDVATVIAKAAFSARFQVATPPTAHDVEALFEGLSQRTSPQAVPGLSDTDVLDLRETLNALLPGHHTLANLAATRYWSAFREIAAHISDQDRRSVLSLLWGRDPAFSALFDRLCDGVEKFGHGGEAYASPDAVLGKDVASGWMTRHPRSVIHASTMLALAQSPGPAMNVMNRFGQAVEIERAVIAGLIAELPMHVSGSRMSELAPADILDFPVPLSIASLAGQAQPRSHAPANDDLSLAVEHFARAKAIYLLERACLRHDLTSLVAILNADEEDDTFAPAIGDFVETAQGPTAQARERVRRGLHIIALKPSEYQASVIVDGEGSDSGRMRRMLDTVIGQGQEWPRAWTPNRPLAEVFWFDAGATQSHAGSWQQTSGGPMGVAAGATLATSYDQGAVQGLTAALQLSSEPRMRQVQLSRALQEVRKQLHACVLRHHASNAPAALADWRRGVAVVIQDRIQYLIESRRLGHLIRALLPLESDFLRAIAAAPGRTSALTAAATTHWMQAMASAPGRAPESGALAGTLDLGAANRMAERAVDYWLKEMRRTARSGRLCRALGLEQRVLHNLVDELQIGAVRIGLAREIAQVFHSMAEPALDPGAAADRLAAASHRLINAYLELLSLPAERGRGAPERPIRLAVQDGEVADAGAGQYSSLANRWRGPGRRTGKPPLEQWDVAFGKLVEDNIASAQVAMGRGGKDRELGELIQLFASGPFEVEL